MILSEDPYERHIQLHTPEVLAALEAEEADRASQEGGEESSLGTNSSTSESKQDKSGSSAQETGSSLQSPAPTADSPSSADQASSQDPSSTAPSTSGSTQETGVSQQDQSTSSEDPQTAQPSGTVATAPLSGEELMHAARLAYEAKDWDGARQLLEDAAKADPSLADQVTIALEAVATASAASGQ